MGYNKRGYRDDVSLAAENVDVIQSCWSNYVLYLGGPNEDTALWYVYVYFNIGECGLRMVSYNW